MKMNEAMQHLRDRGYKMTNKRKNILTFFTKEDGYRTAKDLIQYMEAAFPGISFDTVYRNLHLFHEINILETTELNGEKLFRISCSQHHHHHFICKECGKTKEIDVCPMQEVTNALTNYSIEDHKFEIYGRCPACKMTS